jgi:hypothetical protein
MGAYNIDTNWYTDSGSTDHITSELNKLSMREKYYGNDQIHTASGAGMDIKHIGHSIVPSPIRDLHLNKLPHQKQHHEKYKHALKKFLGICSLYARD